MASLSTIKNWFTTGKKPTEQQFSETWDSFRHKNDKIPIADVTGIDNLFSEINAHFNSQDAHAQLFLNTKIYRIGEMQIFKAKGNVSNRLEVNDIATFLMADGVTFIANGKYLGGDIQDVNSWNASPIDFS